MNTIEDSSDVEFHFINELGRKAVHLTVLLIPLGYHWLKFPLGLIQLSVFGALCFFVPLEIYRLKINPYTRINYFTRQSEKTEPANYVLTTIVWLIILLGANKLYPIKIAELALVATVLGDSAAALVGKGLGRMRLPFTQKKTIEGYMAGLIGTYIVGFLFLLIIGDPSYFLPLLPCVAWGIFDFFEDLPFWAADNLFHPLLTLFFTIILEILGFIPFK